MLVAVLVKEISQVVSLAVNLKYITVPEVEKERILSKLYYYAR